jgi:hypothetical protein
VPGVQTSLESQVAIHSPRAAAIPLLRAATTPEREESRM